MCRYDRQLHLQQFHGVSSRLATRINTPPTPAPPILVSLHPFGFLGLLEQTKLA